MKDKNASINYAIFKNTEAEIQALARANPVTLVAFSGGKDSLVLLDLCSKAFQKVVCFFMYLVPNLAVAEKQLDYARDRYGVEILQYPHWATIKSLKNGVYCNVHPSWDAVKEQTVNDVHEWVKADTGIPIIAHGAKKSDSLWRRRYMAARKNKKDGAYYPLADWNKYEVLAYLGLNNIPLPETSSGGKKAASGLGLMTECLLWLHDEHPEDFAKVLTWYPYAEAVVYRRDWYGIKY
jgi:3'-phosphoadenosine 5'-phosphosulfate sulfotransferase (PAPS reductase)/FAD synthetase